MIRLWELPVEMLLQGGLATLPLAPLANIGNRQLPEVISAMSKRILLRSGRRRLGDPSSNVTSMIEAIGDVEVLEELIDQIGDVGTWNELIALIPVGS